MSHRPGFVVSAGIVLLSFLGAVALWRCRRTASYSEIIIVCFVTASVAVVGSSLAAHMAAMGTKELSQSSVSAYELEVVGDAMPTNQGFRNRARVIKEHASLGDVWFISTEILLRGTRLRCVGRFATPGDDGWGRSLKAQGMLGSIRAVRIIERADPSGPIGSLENIRQGILKTIEPDASEEQALIAALSLGWRLDFRERGLSDLFSMCGMSHIAAVSGTHVSIVCALVAAVLVRTGATPRIRTAFLIVISGLFVLISGASPSSLRAWVMSIGALSAHFAGRRTHALSALSLCCLAMALAKPGLSGDVGFLLSFICVAALCLFSRYAGYVVGSLVHSVRLPSRFPKRIRRMYGRESIRLSQACGAALVCACASLPVSASAFGRVSLAGPLINALLGVPVSALVSLSVAISATSWVPLLQKPLLGITKLLAGAFMFFLRAVARLPGVSCTVEIGQETGLLVAIACGVMLYVFWPRVSGPYLLRCVGAVAAAWILVAVRWRFFAPARICVLDVGQGDAILIQDGSAALLVDTGPDGSAARELSRLNVSHLDAVVITHLHDDHYGGLDELFGQVSCDAVFVGSGAREFMPDELEKAVRDVADSEACELDNGSSINVGSFTIEVIWPREKRSGTTNEDSLVLSVCYERGTRSLRALLTGDAEHDVLEACIAAGDVGDIDLLKVGHHGSEISLSEEDAQTLHAGLAIASAGWNNSYGHPSETCVRILEDSGAIVLCTKDVGTIVVEPDDGSMRVRETGAAHEVE